MSDIPKKLSAQQEETFLEYEKKWLDIGLCIQPADRELAEHGFALAFAAAKLPAPTRVHWTNGPLEGFLRAVELTYGPKATNAQKSELLSETCYGQFDASWVGFHDFFLREIGVEECRCMEGLIEISKACGWFWGLQHEDGHTEVVASERPLVIKLDERQRLHRPDGPAIAYPDGLACYQWHGIEVPEDILLKPELITPKRIQAEQNQEIRRVLMARYGVGRYFKDIDAKVVHEVGASDNSAETGDRGGKLYKHKIHDEEFAVVELLNSTPEPDGSAKPYWISVPPTVQTVQAARAWICREPEDKPIRFDVET